MDTDILKVIKNLEQRVKTLEKTPITSLTLTGALVIPVLAADPSTPSNGEIWYNSTSNTFKCYQNSLVKTFTVS